jgi:hypothetical protein
MILTKIAPSSQFQDFKAKTLTSLLIKQFAIGTKMVAIFFRFLMICPFHLVMRMDL